MVKIYFQTHGCSTNQSESEIMKGLLREAHFKIVSDARDADLIIINVCTVKGEEKPLREIRKLKESFPEKKMIVAGCITKVILGETRKIKDDISFINTHNILSVVEVVEENINDNVVEALGKDEYKKINLPKLRKNPVVGIVPILNGCAGYCSYCSVKYVKGRLFSYPLEDIRKEALKCLNDGCRELWITSQDNAAYMIDREAKTKLPELVADLASIETDFSIRIGMMNPGHLLDVLEDMIKVYKNSKIFKFLHVPIQSGNDDILRLMKRNYTSSDFKKIISKFTNSIPDITISTDLIVGFPTETDQQFRDSLDLIKAIRPDVLNISRFQPRPGTPAAKMDGQLDGGIIKERSRLLTDIFTNISRMNNERWIDWEGDVLIDEKGKDDSWIGRNFAYKPVVVKGNIRLGDIVRVKIKKVAPYDLRA